MEKIQVRRRRCITPRGNASRVARRSGGGGGIRTRVHGGPGGGSTGLADAWFSLAGPASAGAGLPASRKLRSRSVEADLALPSPLATPLPARGPCGGDVATYAASARLLSAVVVSRQFYEATGTSACSSVRDRSMSRPIRPHTRRSRTVRTTSIPARGRHGMAAQASAVLGRYVRKSAEVVLRTRCAEGIRLSADDAVLRRTTRRSPRPAGGRGDGSTGCGRVAPLRTGSSSAPRRRTARAAGGPS